jgi:hypothetical protein
MATTPNGVWISLLQRRAEHLRQSAAAARTPYIAQELGELALIYADAATRAETQPPPPVAPHLRPDPRAELIQHLKHRGNQFLVRARTDPPRAEELKFLAGAFGAEAVRLRANGPS